jgi:hypothetical protein
MARHSRRGSSNWVHSGNKWAKLHRFRLKIYTNIGRSDVNLETLKNVLSCPVLSIKLMLALASTVESELLYDWRFTANQFVLASSPLRPTTRFFFDWTPAVIVLM